jgi:hypothetical protein
LFQNIITDEVKRAFISYFNGRQPMLFYTAFIYTNRNETEQDVHRDVLRSEFPIVDLILDIEGKKSTTKVIFHHLKKIHLIL